MSKSGHDDWSLGEAVLRVRRSMLEHDRDSNPSEAHCRAIACARDIRPTLRDSGYLVDGEGMLPVSTTARLGEAGLWSLPLESSQWTLRDRAEVIEELAQGCGSASWALAAYVSHADLLSRFRVEPSATSSGWRCSGTLERPGAAVAVQGGWEISGHWESVVGAHYAQWHLVKTEGAVHPHEQRIHLIPAGELGLGPPAFQRGLRGSGTGTVFLERVFVPEGRSLPLEEVKAAPVDLRTFCVLGMVCGAIDYWREWSLPRTGLDGVPIREKPFSQTRLSECVVETDIARHLLRQTLHPLPWDSDRASSELPALTARRVAYAMLLCRRSVDRLVEAAGGSGLAEKSPLQRAFRDVHAALSHPPFRWDAQATRWAKGRLESPSTFPPPADTAGTPSACGAQPHAAPASDRNGPPNVHNATSFSQGDTHHGIHQRQ